MDLVYEIEEYKIYVSYDGRYYVYCNGENDGKTITSKGLRSLADALIFIGNRLLHGMHSETCNQGFEDCQCLQCKNDCVRCCIKHNVTCDGGRQPCSNFVLEDKTTI